MKPIQEQLKQALTEALTTGKDVDVCVIVCHGETFKGGYVGGDAWGGRPDEILEEPRKFYTMKQGQRMIATYRGWQEKAAEAQTDQDMANAKSNVNAGETIEERKAQIAQLNWTLWGLKLGRDLTRAGT